MKKHNNRDNEMGRYDWQSEKRWVDMGFNGAQVSTDSLQTNIYVMWSGPISPSKKNLKMYFQ